jgi:hypothetical protein
MSTTASELPIILFNEEFPTLTDALKINPAYQALQVTGAQAGLKYVTSETISLFIISIRTTENLVFLATMVSESKKKNSFVKFIVINHVKNRLFDKTLIKLGILDIIDGSVTTKALRYKLDYALKSLDVQTKKETSLRINWLPPIEKTKDDMWILKSESYCKKINKKCLVSLMGPSPFIGRWIETDRTDQWEFSFKLNKDLFSPGSGRWLFEGQQKPKFIWDDNLWRLTGEAFELFYVENGIVYTRVKFKERFLSITKNSQTAMLKEKLIIESLDKNLLFKNGAEKLDDYELDEGSVEKYENLKGMAKTDHLTFDPLLGKGQTSDLSSPLLSLEIENTPQKKNKDAKINDAKPEQSREENKKHKTSEAPLTAEGHTTDLSSALLTLGVENNPQRKNKDSRSETEELHDKKEKQRASDREFQSNKDSQRSDARDLFIQTEEPFKKKNKDSQATVAQENAELQKTNESGSVAPSLEIIEPKAKILLEISAKEKFLKDFIKNKRAELQRKAIEKSEGEQEKSFDEVEAKNVASEADVEFEAEHLNRTTINLWPQAPKSLRANDSHERVEAKENKACKEPEVNQEIYSGEAKNKKLHDEEAGELEPPADDEKPQSTLLGFQTLLDDLKEEVRPESLSDLKEFKQRRQRNLDEVIQKREPQNPKATSSFAALIESHRQRKQELESNKNESPINIKVVKTKATSKKKIDLDASASASASGSRDAMEKVLMGLFDNPRISVFLIQGDYAITGNFDDFFGQELFIYTNLSRLKTKQPVIVSMSFRYMEKETRLELEGSITDLTPIDNGFHLVSIQLTEKMIKSFEKMMHIFNERQKSISLFMQQARGL